jgi:hypothetical protein
MAHSDLARDCSIAAATAIADMITFLREEERAEFAREASRACMAMLESFQILANRQELRIAPSTN